MPIPSKLEIRKLWMDSMAAHKVWAKARNTAEWKKQQVILVKTEMRSRILQLRETEEVRRARAVRDRLNSSYQTAEHVARSRAAT